MPPHLLLYPMISMKYSLMVCLGGARLSPSTIALGFHVGLPHVICGLAQF